MAACPPLISPGRPGVSSRLHTAGTDQNPGREAARHSYTPASTKPTWRLLRCRLRWAEPTSQGPAAPLHSPPAQPPSGKGEGVSSIQSGLSWPLSVGPPFSLLIFPFLPPAHPAPPARAAHHSALISFKSTRGLGTVPGTEMEKPSGLSLVPVEPPVQSQACRAAPPVSLLSEPTSAAAAAPAVPPPSEGCQLNLCHVPAQEVAQRGDLC